MGIGGAGTYQEAYEINDKYSALEEGTSWNFLMLKETTNKTTIYDSTGKYFKEVHHKEEKKEEITAGGSAAIGIGFEVSINLKEIYNFLPIYLNSFNMDYTKRFYHSSLMKSFFSYVNSSNAYIISYRNIKRKL